MFRKTAIAAFAFVTLASAQTFAQEIHTAADEALEAIATTYSPSEQVSDARFKPAPGAAVLAMGGVLLAAKRRPTTT